MTTEHDAWLASRIEEPIDPDLPICDPHHHLWDRPGSTYLLQQVLQDTGSGHHVVQTVFVECDAMYRPDGPQALRPVGETEFVEAIAAQAIAAQAASGPTAIAAGIVGFADLTLGANVAAVLEAHMAASPGRFRGIRHRAAWDPSPEISSHKGPPAGLLLDGRFRQGFACLPRYGLSFDAWLYHPQLMELADLARAFPDVSIILDHIGGPLGIGPYAGQRDSVFQAWKRSIAALADCPNVAVKLGGLGMQCCGFGWDRQRIPPSSAEMAEAMAPYYLWCIERFGADRCMFESNFPVDRISSSYTVLWNAFKRVARDLTPHERAALFHDTAARVYRLAARA
jgi:predicted TIM-barrel fold metal-dependent hydrolase